MSPKEVTRSMTGDLMQVLVCPPSSAGWDRPEIASAWRDLGFHAPPQFDLAQKQHELFCYLLSEARVEIVCLPSTETLTLDAVYTRDSSIVVDDGLILMNPGKITRHAEARAHAKCCSRLGIDVVGEVRTPGIAEAGDFFWLDTTTLMIGQGYRTNKDGIEQIRALPSLAGVEVVSVPLPYGRGPSACLHLTSLMSMLDEVTILVDLPWLTVDAVELLRARGFRLIETDDHERETLASNVLSLGSNRLLAIEENVSTNRRLRNAGFEVLTFPGSEICINGCGGPTCLTQPLARKVTERSSGKFTDPQAKTVACTRSSLGTVYVS